jgi:hypothetical protein
VRPSAASLPSATAAAGSTSSGHLRPNRALICDPNCSTFSFLPVLPPSVVCARRSGTRRWRRSSWSGRPPPPRRVIRELIDDEDPSPLLTSLPPRGAHPRAGCCFPWSSSAQAAAPRGRGAGAHAAPSTRSPPAARAEPPAAERGSSPAVRGAAPAVRAKVGGAPGGGHGGPNRQGLACCKSMIRVFETFQKNVASVKCEYCKSRP